LKVLIDLSKHFPPDVPFGAPDRRVVLHETLLNPETDSGVRSLTFVKRISFKFSQGTRVKTDQGLVHEISKHAKKHENQHFY
jgi:hypothetical protein